MYATYLMSNFESSLRLVGPKAISSQFLHSRQEKIELTGKLPWQSVHLYNVLDAFCREHNFVHFFEFLMQGIHHLKDISCQSPHFCQEKIESARKNPW